MLALLVLLAGSWVSITTPNQSLLYRVRGLLVVAARRHRYLDDHGAGACALGVHAGARAEVRKVVWPTRQETMQTTLVVMVMVVVVGIFLWLLDMVCLLAGSSA